MSGKQAFVNIQKKIIRLVRENPEMTTHLLGVMAGVLTAGVAGGYVLVNSVRNVSRLEKGQVKQAIKAGIQDHKIEGLSKEVETVKAEWQKYCTSAKVREGQERNLQLEVEEMNRDYQAAKGIIEETTNGTDPEVLEKLKPLLKSVETRLNRIDGLLHSKEG